MKKIALYLLFGIIGLIICIISSSVLENVIFNLKDTYYVINSRHFGIAVLLFYLFYTLIYFIFKKYSHYIFGILNLIFVTISVVFLMFSELALECIAPRKFIEHPILLKIEAYLPLITFILFTIGNLFLLLNIVLTIINRKKSKRKVNEPKHHTNLG